MLSRETSLDQPIFNWLDIFMNDRRNFSEWLSDRSGNRCPADYLAQLSPQHSRSWKVGEVLCAFLLVITSGFVSAQALPTPDSGTVGGQGGTPFLAECGPGEVLVGLGVRSGSAIDQVNARCAGVNASGSWTSAPVQRGGVFGGTGGAGQQADCPQNHAVVGFSGSFGPDAFSDIAGYLQLRCGRLNSSRTTTTDMVAVGGYGLAQSDLASYSCSSGHAAIGIYGASGVYVDRFGITCDQTGSPDRGAFGEWSGVVDWPLIGIHAVLTPQGEVLTFGTDENGVQGAQFFYDVWNPAQGTDSSSHFLLNNSLAVDSFCSAPIVIPDSGNILMPGGDQRDTGVANRGIFDAPVFDTTDKTLGRAADMGFARWYPSSTVLSSGEILLTGGIDGAGIANITPEIYDPSSDSWRSLFGATSNAIFGPNWWYPRQWLAPDGRVFGMAGDAMYYINVTGNGSISRVGNVSTVARGYQSTAVMYQPGRILQLGSGDSGNGAFVVDINSGTPQVRTVSSLAFNRQAWATATVLPDGQVLVSGGSPQDNQIQGASFTSELWNPDTETWSQLASAVKARLYHSTSLLLPDGRVLLAGGGAPGPQTNTNAEIFTPPNLLQTNGESAPRISINSAPTSAGFGQTISVGYSGQSVARVTLVRNGAVTHSIDMDQRFIEAEFTGSNGQLSVVMPDVSTAPPGYYMLFLLDNSGTPSVASIIKLAEVENEPPVITSRTPAGEPLVLTEGQTIQVVITATDDQTIDLDYAANSLSDQIASISSIGDGVYSLTANQSGNTAIRLTVVDEEGAFAIEEFSVRVETGVTNQAPVITSRSPAGDPLDLVAGETLQVTIAATDDQTSALNYSASSGANSVATVSSDGSGLFTVVANQPGTTFIRLTVTDEQGLFDVDDFSIRVTGPTEPGELEPGETVNESIAQGDWDYYTITTDTSVAALIVQLSGMTSDGDLYVRAGSQPTLDTYDCRSWVGGNGNEQCVMDNSERGITTWYIGVYGYRSTGYSLLTDFTVVEPEPEAQPLNSGESLSTNVPLRNWRYFSISTDNTAESLSVLLDGMNADGDLYVRADSRPTLANYDCRSYVGGTAPESCTLDNNGATQWYVGVYGYQATSFTVLATIRDGETESETVTFGETLSGVLGLQQWQFFEVEVPAGVSAVTARLSGMTADGDLYLRNGARPSGTVAQGGTYDCGSYAGGSATEVCTIDVSGNSSFFIGLYGYNSTPFDLLVTAVNPENEPVYTVVTNGETATGSVAQQEWQFYRLDPAPGTQQLSVQLDQLTNDADLYVRRGQLPAGAPSQGAGSDCFSLLGGTSAESCVVNVDGQDPWYIGVYGYQASDYSISFSSSLVRALKVDKPKPGNKTDNFKVVRAGGGGGPVSFWFLMVTAAFILRRRSARLQG